MEMLFPLSSNDGNVSLISGNGVSFTCRQYYINGPEPCWALDIFTNDNTVVFRGLPLLEGHNLLSDYTLVTGEAGIMVVSDGDYQSYNTPLQHFDMLFYSQGDCYV